MNSSGIKEKVYKFFSLFFSNDAKPDSIIEPLTCLIRLSILEYKPVGTKISVSNNKIQYNDPNLLQGAIRWSNGDAREDLHNIFNPIRKAVEWFDKDDEQISHIFKCSIKGLYRLKKSYHPNSVVSHSIQYYIDYIDNNLNDDKSNNKDKKMNSETNTLYLKLKEFWTPREIIIINNLFLELENNRQKSEEDTNFNTQQNTLIKAIETLLSSKEDAVSKLLFETTTYLK